MNQEVPNGPDRNPLYDDPRLEDLSGGDEVLKHYYVSREMAVARLAEDPTGSDVSKALEALESAQAGINERRKELGMPPDSVLPPEEG